MNVTLLSHTPNPEQLIACAARLCYSSADVQSVMDGLTPEKTEEFIRMLSDMGHESPFEHVTFTFGIEGVSRSLLAQITRHRMASFSVKSQRYVKEFEFSYVTPPEIAAIPEAFEIYQSVLDPTIFLIYELWTTAEAHALHNTLPHSKVHAEECRGIYEPDFKGDFQRVLIK